MARSTTFQWRIPDRLPACPDCLIIPSYALKDRHMPTSPTCAQIDRAVAWWRRHPQAVLIMSTGDNQGLGVTNAQVMAEYALRQGVPDANVIQEDKSLNTFENLRHCREIVTREGWVQPTFFTMDLYTRRVVATARKMGWPDFYWCSVFSPGQPAYGYKWLQTSSRPAIFCYEVLAMAFSRLVGWV